MSALLTLAQAAPLLGCRDPRTARKRLAALGVPVLELDGRLYVDEGDLLRARRAHARPLAGAGDVPSPGVQLSAGVRLWDPPASKTVGRRRANAPALGEQA